MIMEKLNHALAPQLLKRQVGLISAAIQQRKVVAIGTGAGSQLLLDLGKQGLGEITGIDFDYPEIHNISRTAYRFTDAMQNRPKVECLAELMKEQCPITQFKGLARNYCELTREERDAIFKGCDLILYLADSFEAAAQVNQDSLHYGIPAVFVGIHEQGHSGRILWQIPGQSPCYYCMAQERYQAHAAGEVGLDLDGGNCTLTDVKIIDAIALKITLGLLERDQDSAYGRWGRRLIESQRNEIIIRTDPVEGFGNTLWEAILDDLPESPKPYAEELQKHAFFAMDSLWLKTDYLPNCECSKRRQ